MVVQGKAKLGRWSAPFGRNRLKKITKALSAPDTEADQLDFGF